MISGFYILWGFACGFKNVLSYFSTAFVLGNMLNKAGRCPPAEYGQGVLHSLPVPVAYTHLRAHEPDS